jgi:uracil-DNA glycosylase
MTLQDRLRRDFGGWRTRMPPAWRPYFDGVELGFDVVDPNVEIRDDEQIWPMAGNGGPDGADTFKSLRGLTPGEVRVVIFGNDPYTKLKQATGRSFEQGDLRDWNIDIKEHGLVSPSLQTLLCAAAATSEEHAAFDLKSQVDLDPDEGFVWRGHQELARGLVVGGIRLPDPQAIFDHWARQGVLWLNRTLTYSRWMDDHRPNHTKLWAPFTARVIQVVLEAAARRGTPVVFTLWGTPAQQLQASIKAEISALGLQPDVARFAVAAHPQLAGPFFRDGNPLERINELLVDRPVRWL